ncbi:MAG: hypothetical protein Kow0099_05900 [Candidatus Abyssubacteria bacterium]
MMFRTQSVGIDIQPDSVRMAVAIAQGGHMKVQNLAVRKIPEAPEHEARAAIASIIKDLFGENNLNGDTSVVCLPAAMSINRYLTTPITDYGRICQTLKFQMEPQIPYPVEQVVSDFIPLRKTNEGTEMLAVAVTKEKVSDALKLLELAEIDPQIVTIDALALADFYVNPFDFSSDKITALLHVGPRSTFLGFFSGQKLIGYRNLDGAPGDDEHSLRKLAKETQRSMLTFQSPPSIENGEIGTLCVSGDHADKLQWMFQQNLRDLPIRVLGFNENALAEIPPGLMDLADDCKLAIALARVGLQSSLNTINLRQEEFAPVSPLTRLRPNIRFSLVVLGIVLALWFGSVLTEIRHLSREREALNHEMVNIFSDTMPTAKTPEAIRQEIRLQQDRFKALRNHSSEYVSPLDVLAEVNASNPDKKLVLTDFAISENVLRMTGEADSFDDVNIFQGKLEDSALLSKVKIDSAAKAEKTEKINFRIRAEIARESGQKPAPVPEEAP